MNFRVIRIFVSAFFIILSFAAQSQQTDLGGQWIFALDPVKVGEAHRWYSPGFPDRRWDKVTVPHSYTIDPRYHNYTGSAWYIREVTGIKIQQGMRAFLHFDAVFYKCDVWVNGQKAGSHEGGYTPFELDVTELLADTSTIAVHVNNAWDTTTIPGAKTKVPYENDNVAQFFPWLNYGGITRKVSMIVRPDCYIRNVRVIADPDLSKMNANLEIEGWVRNISRSIVNGTPVVNIYHGKQKIPVKFKTKALSVGNGKESVFNLSGNIASRDLKLWSHDAPNLYVAEVIFQRDTFRTQFGVRKVEVRGTKLLLNGEPVSMGGCNRPLDYPGFGSMDPQKILEQDLRLIKNGSMELSRISHYPVSTALLDWADENGLLLIGEAGNWQMTPKQMADSAMRKKFRTQMTEMMERDWNHPSVIAWSVGNEYQSQTGEGQAWTKDMYAFTKALDPTRLVTFASMIVFRDNIKKPEDEASQYVDFISANIYGNHLANLKHIHEIYPGKPVYVSEFGLRTDGVKDEADRVAHLKKAMEDFRQCDFIIGASVWTFNDYKSSYPGTNANGYRPWGLVSPERKPRDMYYAWQEEFAPATLAIEHATNGMSVTVKARNDFPSYVLRGYTLRAGDQSFSIPVLKPGETAVFKVPATGAVDVSLIKPGGFIVVSKNVKVPSTTNNAQDAQVR